MTSEMDKSGPATDMTLRDWFAGQALASMSAAPDYSKGPCNAVMAQRAYIIAERMLEERSKFPTTYAKGKIDG